MGRKKIEGKGEDAGYQHFLLFPRFFQRAFHGMVENIVGMEEMLVLAFSLFSAMFSKDLLQRLLEIKIVC